MRTIGVLRAVDRRLKARFIWMNSFCFFDSSRSQSATPLFPIIPSLLLYPFMDCSFFLFMVPFWDTVFWIPSVSWLGPLSVPDHVNTVLFFSSIETRTNIWPSVRALLPGRPGRPLHLHPLRAEEPVPSFASVMCISVPFPAALEWTQQLS